MLGACSRDCAYEVIVAQFAFAHNAGESKLWRTSPIHTVVNVACGM